MSFVPGHSYLVFCKFTRPPKEKFIICLTASDPASIFFISSEPRRLHPAHTQVAVSPQQLTYLNYGSYINTAERSVCFRETCEIKHDYGRLPPSIINAVLEQVRESLTLPPKTIREILADFG